MFKKYNLFITLIINFYILALSDKGSMWSHTTLYESAAGGNAADSTTLALISDCSSIIVYDTRHLGSALLHSKLQGDRRLISTDVHSLCVKFKPSDIHTVSVSGLNSNVYVLDVSKDQPKELFVHDGHRFTESGCKEALTSSHIWFSPTELDNILISSSYNKTIQIWQFNIT